MESGTKVLIFSAPSGAGKTTLVHYLLQEISRLEFSISATSRPKRQGEIDGKDYYFLSPEDFKNKISDGDFIEWEEVYENNFYGTLKSEIERITANEKVVIFDVDVEGGVSLKNYFGKNALAVFVMPPSVEELEKRLRKRNTETDEAIYKRISKAKYELTFAPKFDITIVNENLDVAKEETLEAVKRFIKFL